MTILFDNPLLQKCLFIASTAHANQTRHDKKTPYITHPIAVACMFLREEDIRLMAIALLHDVIEDSIMTAETLVAEGIPQDVIEVVEILTKRVDENYFTYLSRVKQHPFATLVKIADIQHNSIDLHGHQKDKYLMSIDYLTK